MKLVPPRWRVLVRRALRLGPRNMDKGVPRQSWQVFRAKDQITFKDPVENLSVHRTPDLAFVQANVKPSKMQTTIMWWGTILFVGAATFQFMSNLHSVPITGRTQVVVLSQDEEVRLGNDAADEELGNATLITSGPRLRMCVNVAARLVCVSEHLFPRQYDWRVWLVDAPQVANACCFPGGKIVIYSGILDVVDAAVRKGIVSNPHDALAVILSHEMSHALARHAAERVSLVPITYVQMALGMQSPLLRYVFEFAMNLPFSRKQEVEADHIGIMLMASACYDPQTAPNFWRAFHDELAAAETPFDLDFLSTHPSHAKREHTLAALVPEALARRRRASWCQQLKERAMQAIGTEASGGPTALLPRIIEGFRSERKAAIRRHVTGGTIHEAETREIDRAMSSEAQDGTAAGAGP